MRIPDFLILTIMNLLAGKWGTAEKRRSHRTYNDRLWLDISQRVAFSEACEGTKGLEELWDGSCPPPEADSPSPSAPMHAFVESQEDLHSGYLLGCKKSKINGCGVIAVYNILRSLNIDRPIPELIEAFEEGGLVLKGAWGTAPGFMHSYLSRTVGLVETSTASDLKKIQRLRHLQGSSPAHVLLSLNDKNSLLKGMHYMAITRSEGGSGFIVHNIPGGRPALCDSLQEALDYPFPGRSVPLLVISLVG